jgi:hypothetical protein
MRIAPHDGFFTLHPLPDISFLTSKTASIVRPKSPAPTLLGRFHPERPQRPAISAGTAELTPDSSPFSQQLFLHCPIN